MSTPNLWLKFIFSGEQRVNSTSVFNPERVAIEAGREPQVRLDLRSDGKTPRIREGDILYIVAYAEDNAGVKSVRIVAKGELETTMPNPSNPQVTEGYFKTGSFEYLNAPIVDCIDLKGLWDALGNTAFPNSNANTLEAVYAQKYYVGITPQAREWIDTHFRDNNNMSYHSTVV